MVDRVVRRCVASDPRVDAGHRAPPTGDRHVRSRDRRQTVRLCAVSGAGRVCWW